MKLRSIITTLLTAVTLTLAACGTPGEVRPAKPPTSPPAEQDYAARWLEYYDATLSPFRVNDTEPTIEERRQAYYEATHPSPHPASRPIPVEPDNGIA